MIEIFGSQPGASSGAGNPAQLAIRHLDCPVQHGIRPDGRNSGLDFLALFRARVDGYLLGMELASEQFVRHLSRLQAK